MSREPRIIDVAALIDRSSLGRFNYRVIALSWLVTAFDELIREGLFGTAVSAPTA